jgi:hypothetical protein
MDYGPRDRAERVNLVYVFESRAHRTVESNDGRRIVELVRFDRVTSVKLLTQAENLALDLGPPGVPVLGDLHDSAAGVGTTAVPVEAVSRAVLQAGASAATDDSARAFVHVDRLSGKRVRLGYVDGAGVEFVETVGCRLIDVDCEFLFHAPVLSDACILPDPGARPGEAWSVDATQLAGFLDPSMRWIPHGTLTVERPEHGARGAAEKTLCMRSGGLSLYAPGEPLDGFGFWPTGTIRYDARDGHVTAAEFKGPLCGYTRAQDHLLASVACGDRLTLHVRYGCWKSQAVTEQEPSVGLARWPCQAQ